MHSLIPSTNNTLATSKEPFKAFLKVLQSINPSLSEQDILLIKQSMQNHDVLAKELEPAIAAAYEDPDRYGKVEWNDIWKHIQQNRYGKIGRSLTYEEMNQWCKEHNCTSDDFRMTEAEKDNRGRCKWVLK